MFRSTDILSTVLMLLIAPCLLAQSKSSPDIRPLSLDGPTEREMKGGEFHSYSLALDAGQFLYVIAEQHSIDVVVTIFGPDGRKLLEVDSSNFWHGIEPVSIVVDTKGSYRLEVRSRKEEAVSGRYKISVVELRAATGGR